ncbi:MAG TPA: hypothetical protein VGD53_17515 [Actinoallomurus sp.]
MGKKWPGGLPPNVREGQDLMSLGALTMIITVFLALVGQGCPPREALAVTLALGLGGTEVIKRLRDGDSRGRR